MYTSINNESKERSDNDDLYRERRISTTEFSDQRRDNDKREVRNDEVRVSKKSKEGNVSSNVDERDLNQSSERDRGNITETNRIDNGTDESRTSSNRRIEIEKSDEVDWNDEQYQESSRRDNNERNDLRLEEEAEENINNGILFSNEDKYDYKRAIKYL